MTPPEIISIIGGLSIGYALVWFITRKNKTKNSNYSTLDGEKEHSTNNNSQQKDDPTAYENEAKDNRIFSCPSCKQKIRVKMPLKFNTGKCIKCNSKFHISTDESGNLYITGSSYSKEKSEGDSHIDSIDDCFNILGILNDASPEKIKSAYRKKMKEYHPDKVAHLGEKLKVIAESEAKKLNSAYLMLKDDGYI